MDAGFQLICDSKGARLKLTPATDGGAPIEIGTWADSSVHVVRRREES